jgi:hypothetical protein
VRSLPPDADLVAAYGEFAHSLTLPGFLTRAAGAGALIAEKGLDFEGTRTSLSHDVKH